MPFVHAVAVAAICLAGIVAYANSLNGPFVYDDLRAILQNESIRIEGLSPSSLWKAAFTGASARRPVAGITLALNYYSGGYSVEGYHIVNIFIHIINGILLYILCFNLLKIFKAYEIRHEKYLLNPFAIGSLVAALVFVLHPIQTQAVSYVIQRMTSLATMFHILAFILYLKGRSRIGIGRWAFFACSFSAWVMGLGSKEIAAALPVAVFAFEWCMTSDVQGYASFKKFYLWLAVIVAAAVPVFVFLGADPVREILETYRHYEFTVTERLLTQLRVVVFYVSLILFPLPARLNLDHYMPVSRSLLDPMTTFLSLIVLLFLFAVAVYYRKRNPLAAFCIFWFFIHLVMESSVIGLDLVFEHRLYLPMAGVSVAIGYLVLTGFLKGRILTAALSCLAVLLLGWGTVSRNTVWQDEVRLWQDVVSKNPHSYWARNSLGMAYLHRGSVSDAVSQLNEALKIRPDHSPTRINLAVAMARQEKIHEARGILREVLERNSRDFEALYNLGVILAGEGMFEDAMDHFKRANDIRPGSEQVNVAMGKIHLAQGRIEEALKYIQNTVRKNPSSWEGHFLLGGIYLRKGDSLNALEEYQKALRLNPRDPSVHTAMGDILVKTGRMPEGIRHYMEALRFEPSEALRKRILELLEAAGSK